MCVCFLFLSSKRKSNNRKSKKKIKFINPIVNIADQAVCITLCDSHIGIIILQHLLISSSMSLKLANYLNSSTHTQITLYTVMCMSCKIGLYNLKKVVFVLLLLRKRRKLNNNIQVLRIGLIRTLHSDLQGNSCTDSRALLSPDWKVLHTKSLKKWSNIFT